MSIDNFAQKLIDFQDSFTDRLRTKFSTKLYSPPYLTDVAALPCKLQCFENRINSKMYYRRTLFWSIFADVPA